MAHDPPNGFFPQTERVSYQSAPLVQVTCQIKFQPILKIESQLPADFQDRVRAKLPIFRKERDAVIPDVPVEVANLIGQVGSADRIRYIFASEDQNWNLTLTRDFIALVARKYSRWEAFREYLDMGLQSLIEIYQPGSFDRIGLRYIDLITRSKLGLEGTSWRELLRAEILGLLGHEPIERSLVATGSETRFKFSDSSAEGATLRHGIRPDDKTNEKSYWIDFDFYSEGKHDIASEPAILDRFNTRARCAFRWCITKRLHEALRPIPIR